MIKKILSAILVFLFISGCGIALDKDNNNGIDQSNGQNNEGEVQSPIDKKNQSTDISLNKFQTTLMEDVESSDILLYEKTAFIQIEFSVRDSDAYSAGKNIYNISYLSSAEPKDIYAAYIDYIDIAEEEFASDYSLDIKGTVNELPISVSVELSGMIDIEGCPVRITIEDPSVPSENQEENRYFGEYPDLVELYKLKKGKLYHSFRKYTESYLDEIKTYHIAFATTANEEDFTSYYTDNYALKSGFKSEVDEYQKHFLWTDSGFEHKIVLQKSNNMVSVYVKTSLP